MSTYRLEDALNSIKNGSSICFVGAGFSLGALTADGRPVPDTKGLSDAIREIANLQDEKDASLAELAEHCQSIEAMSTSLNQLLMERLTLCQPTDDQRKIMSMPWRAVFTTNFDDVAENALKFRNPIVVTPAFDPRNLIPGRVPLYYLHGRALDILRGASDPRLVVSESNYLKIRERNNNLYAVLENEIHYATAIYFLGYSLRDIEIASRLFAIEGFREKSFVITRASDSKFLIGRLEKFGTVVSIGIDGFAKSLPNPSDFNSANEKNQSLSYVKRCMPQEAATDVFVSSIDRLILSGEFEYNSYAAQQRDNGNQNLYCVKREKSLANTFKAINDSINRIIVTSDLGNGKSVFLEQIVFEAHARGYEVFKIDTQLPEVYTELDRLLASYAKRLFIVDGLVRYRRIARYIGMRLTGIHALIVTSGGGFDDLVHASVSEELSGVTREIDINLLDGEELSSWNELLERWGFWQGRIEKSKAERIEFLKSRCGAENRAIILSMFKSSRLGNKINEIVRYFLRQNEHHQKAFVAILVNALCQNHVTWDRIVSWLGINEAEFKSAVMKSPISDFVAGSRNWYEFTSAELAGFILNNFEFEDSIMVDVYTKIVRETAFSANDNRSGFDARENLKELMRFRFLTKLFSAPRNGINTINTVYHRLSSVQRIRENDQFWLQYAMARMEIDDLKTAETYINTALGLAKKKGAEYSNHQIIDQRCRLRLRRNSLANEQISISEINETMHDLSRLLNGSKETGVHPLRSAVYVLQLLESRIDEMPKETLALIEATLNLMKQRIADGDIKKALKGEVEQIKKDVRLAQITIENY